MVRVRLHLPSHFSLGCDDDDVPYLVQGGINENARSKRGGIKKIGLENDESNFKF